MECVFCKIVKGELKAYRIYEDENILVFLDINPIYKGHMLAIPKKHYSRITEMPEEEYKKFSNSLQKFLKILEDRIGKNYNIVVNQGEKAGQIINHLHFHIIPRDLEFHPVEEKLFKWETHKLTEEEAREVINKF